MKQYKLDGGSIITDQHGYPLKLSVDASGKVVYSYISQWIANHRMQLKEQLLNDQLVQ